MRPIRVLCYADMDAAIANCVTAAEMLRSRLGAHITMTVYSRNVHFHEAFANYELYDHPAIFGRSNRFRPFELARATATAAPPNQAIVSLRREFHGLRKLLGQSQLLKFIFEHLRKLPARCMRWLRDLTRRIPFAHAAALVTQAWYRGRRVRRFLRLVQPDLIILAEDNIERLSATLVNEGHRQGIPSVIIPFTIPNPLEPAKSYRDRTINQVGGLLARLVTSRYPKWLYRLDGQDLIRLPALTALVFELLGQSSPAPWILNRGGAARIALDSEALRDHYLKLGFPADQLSVVGDLSGEILHKGLLNRAALAAELVARHGFEPNRPMILCAFPPDQFTSMAAEFEFESYDALIAAWIDSFRVLCDRANVLVRLHPRISLDRFEAFKVPNVRFTLQPTAELVPLCDLYVASISATIRWALACGIPVINYDTYRYRYGDYDAAAGIIQTESLEDFRTQLGRFVDDPSFAADLTDKQRRQMSYWGILDEQLPDRFIALVLEVLKSGGVEVP